MSSTINGELLKKYISNINNLESNINSFNSKDCKRKGYIINLEDYEKLKNKINYINNKNKFAKKNIEIKSNEKKMIIKELEFKTNQYLINMLLNNNKYIIVDNIFWKIICEKGKEESPSTDYEITNKVTDLNIKFKGQTVLTFDNKEKNNSYNLLRK